MKQPLWEDQPNGSRVRRTNGIRIVDRTGRLPAEAPAGPAIEHLVTWQEDGGRVVVMGLDADCRAVSVTELYDYR